MVTLLSSVKRKVHMSLAIWSQEKFLSAEFMVINGKKTEEKISLFNGNLQEFQLTVGYFWLRCLCYLFCFILSSLLLHFSFIQEHEQEELA